jgi:uncharacterized membrane protein
MSDATTCPSSAEIARQLLDDDDYDDEEREILVRIASGDPARRSPSDFRRSPPPRGEIIADRVAAIGGSWAFIIGFGIVLFSWMLINSGVIPHASFDPYPFIFLNLMLSMLAAIQAPIIMMSQNRQATKDRLAAHLDFETNLRAEIDIMRLHYKLDAVLAERMTRMSRRIDKLEAAPVERTPKPD